MFEFRNMTIGVLGKYLQCIPPEVSNVHSTNVSVMKKPCDDASTRDLHATLEGGDIHRVVVD